MKKHRSLSSILFICVIAFFVSLKIFFPGWMTTDSYAQFDEAKNGIYLNWHPMMMSWWWGKLMIFGESPVPFLIQNLILYWSAWYFLAKGVQVKSSSRFFPLIIPLFGFSPSTFFLLGEQWKDVVFCVTVFFVISFLFYLGQSKKKFGFLYKFIVILLLSFSIGVKPNGVLIMPFIFFYMNRISTLDKKSVSFIKSILITIFSSLIAQIPSWYYQVSPPSQYQYIMVHDILAISTKLDKSYFPKYLVDSPTIATNGFKNFYSPEGNDHFFFHKGFPDLASKNSKDLAELRLHWWQAVKENYLIYISHRWDVFKGLMRVGYSQAAFVALPSGGGDKFNFSFKPNKISKFLEQSQYDYAFIYFPWIWTIIFFASSVFLYLMKKYQMFIGCLLGVWIFFVLPHIVLAPSSDYRYLLLVSTLSLMLLVQSLEVLIRIFPKPYFFK